MLELILNVSAMVEVRYYMLIRLAASRLEVIRDDTDILCSVYVIV